MENNFRDGGARHEQEICLHQSNIRSNTDLFGPYLISIRVKHLLDFLCGLMEEHREKERSCKKEVLVIIILVSSDAILNLCVRVTAGKHFTTQGISLQMEAKIKSLHT